VKIVLSVYQKHIKLICRELDILHKEILLRGFIIEELTKEKEKYNWTDETLEIERSVIANDIARFEEEMDLNKELLHLLFDKSLEVTKKGDKPIKSHLSQ
jgi:hypothetical protein